MRSVIATLLLLTQLGLTQSACDRLIPQRPQQQQQPSRAWPGETAEQKRLTGKVVGVSDGDTITVLDKTNSQYRVRLAGIDAPESKQEFGQASKKNLSDMVFGRSVEIFYTKLDRYERVLGRVIHNGQDINLAQVEAGLAWHYKEFEREQSPEERRAYADAELRAREQRRGLWQQPNPVKPSEFRRKSAGNE